MKITRKFTLERPARKRGGDLYLEDFKHDELPIMQQTYVHQSVSRSGGIPATVLYITVATEPE